jgi:hypothetical protein
MARMISACGVWCSSCPAFSGKAKGIAYQKRTAAAWKRIYRLKETAASIDCGGCQGPEDQLFHTCRRCQAQRCCRAKGLRSCAECGVESCELLEKAQALWDGVPKLVQILSREDFRIYAQPYCDHRRRLERERRVVRRSLT